ncbi:MAG: aromatic amino acid hydroxylase [Bdellovibrionaceae bacterium]|nr:aromatic amino acid hydroxylase [Pseudobdellovibrionaceae bacterium]
MTELPSHLKRYVVTQDYSRYTPVDHAVWRYILRQLRSYLSQHAHPCYLDGLKKTGISIDRIPSIADISQHIEKFGWRAIPVSGFIPPAAFMELQALGFLPIASDMRTLQHMMYTPAPDIVHEAAGHAPILVDPDFAAYLKAYAQVARKAIISHQDMAQYDAIRVLSDLKEHPASTPAQIQVAEQHLNEVTRGITHISEAARLGRMNWWTAEYGLIGSLEDPRIFGAGLLSSVGEARGCLRPEVKKLPLTIACVDYAYDITEPQPQLFVTPSFENLQAVLEELADTMAFRMGGTSGLEKAQTAQTVNTVELDSGLQIGGKLVRWIPAHSGAQPSGHRVAYLQFEGPTQLAFGGHELAGQGVKHHALGFGTPIGFLQGHAGNSLANFDDHALGTLGVRMGQPARLMFESGAVVEGRVQGWLRSPNGRLLVLSFQECTVTLGDKILFQPEWGTFDMGVGANVVSVYGGPPDRESYGLTADFEARRVPPKIYSATETRTFEIYKILQDLREASATDATRLASTLTQALETVEREAPHEWLLKLEALELAERLPSPPPWQARVRQDLENIAESNAELRAPIEDGLRLVSVVS